MIIIKNRTNPHRVYLHNMEKTGGKYLAAPFARPHKGGGGGGTRRSGCLLRDRGRRPGERMVGHQKRCGWHSCCPSHIVLQYSFTPPCFTFFLFSHSTHKLLHFTRVLCAQVVSVCVCAGYAYNTPFDLKRFKPVASFFASDLPSSISEMECID